MGFLDDLPELNLPGRPASKRGLAEGEVDCVPWRSVHCPACGSPRTPVIDSRQIPIRKHRCADCGHEFRSIETNYRASQEESS